MLKEDFERISIGDIITYGPYTGTVICLRKGLIGVDFGRKFSGHNLDGKIFTRTGWYLNRINDFSVRKKDVFDALYEVLKCLK